MKRIEGYLGMQLTNRLVKGVKINSDKKQGRFGEYFISCLIVITVSMILMCGCGHFTGGLKAGSLFKEANDFFNDGAFGASLKTYEQIIEKYPPAGDRVLFEMGIVYSHPRNDEKDYEKALECFHRLIRDYPESPYRKDSEMMVFQIRNVIMKDMTIAAQHAQIESFRQKVIALEQKIDSLSQELEGKEKGILSLQREVFMLRKEPADRILIEKKERRMTLFSKGRVLKTYKIALGGDPDGPKERQGDNKTPEGNYIIESRNRDSQYHLSLRISYPNERDKKRAKELGVSPGGDIMIHGLKNGFSWMGDFHTRADWTRGCVAVTDEEIEEIDKLVPDLFSFSSDYSHIQ